MDVDVDVDVDEGKGKGDGSGVGVGPGVGRGGPLRIAATTFASWSASPEGTRASNSLSAIPPLATSFIVMRGAASPDA